MKQFYFVLLLCSQLGFSQTIESFPYEKEWVIKNPFIIGINNTHCFSRYDSDGSFVTFCNNDTGSFDEFIMDNTQGNRIVITKISSEPELNFGFAFGDQTTTFGGGYFIDEEKNFYLSGRTRMTTGVATPGTHQQNFAANMTLPETVYYNNGANSYEIPPRLCSSAYLIKYDSAGNKIWGTYFNGDREDITNGASTKNNEVVITRQTISNDGLSTPGVFMENAPGILGYQNESGFIAKFDATDGTLLWASYLPVSFNSLSIDSKGDIFLLVKNNSEDTYTHSLIKIASDGSTATELTLEGSFLNNETSQTGYHIAIHIDEEDQLYLYGIATSTTNIATPNTYRTEILHDREQFIIKYDDKLNKSWGTYVSDAPFIQGGGHSLNNIFIKNQSIYTGGTTIVNNTATTGAHQEQIAGGRDNFILKLNAEGQLNWHTYFGGSNDESYFNRITLDEEDNLYFSGATYSPNTEILSKNPLYDHLFWGLIRILQSLATIRMLPLQKTSRIHSGFFQILPRIMCGWRAVICLLPIRS